MTVGEGQFLLYSYITPALKAAAYRFDVDQSLGAQKGSSAIDAAHLPVGGLQTHVTVTSPRYQLPPDQVLSTFPPAGSEGSYGSRLPQIVIKRRTLPWERGLTLPDGHGGQVDVDEKTPWLALVLIAEGEAELKLNQDVAQCVTKGVTLDGAPEVAKGNCLVIRQSIVEKLLPSRKDVPLLAHAREVDINDTELMMGDDDGFLAVVIANRLPVAGDDGHGNEVPVKYLACLINLEGQFDTLIPEAPPHRDTIQYYGAFQETYVSPAVYDHVASGGLVENWGRDVINPGNVEQFAAGPPAVGDGEADAEVLVPDEVTAGESLGATALLAGNSVLKSQGTTTSAFTNKAGYAPASTGVYVEMAKDFEHSIYQFAEPEYTYPVLLHWSFTSTGNETFESLMRGLDSGLSGSLPAVPTDPPRSPPLEVAETGHVGLTNRTRRGDTVRTWYRGPLLPHPSSGERLPIAHASDQLRTVIPDGREDISLATAFEIGRLLALSQPSMVAALMRWRQSQFQATRFDTIWSLVKDTLPFEATLEAGGLRSSLERGLRSLIVSSPDDVIGAYRSPITPGDPVDWGGDALSVMSHGLGMGVDLGKQLQNVGDLGNVTRTVGKIVPPVVGRVVVNKNVMPDVADHLRATLDDTAARLAGNVAADGEDALDEVLRRRPRRRPRADGPAGDESRGDRR